MKSNKESLLLITAVVVFIASIANMVLYEFAISSIDFMFWQSGWDQTQWYMGYLAGSIYVGGLLLGLYNLVVTISGRDRINKRRAHYLVYYGGLVVLVLYAAAAYCQLAGEGWDWHNVKYTAINLGGDIFKAGVLCGLWFLSAPCKRAVPPAGAWRMRLTSKVSGASFNMSCPRCYKEILNEWRVCPYCGEKQFRED